MHTKKLILSNTPHQSHQLNHSSATAWQTELVSTSLQHTVKLKEKDYEWPVSDRAVKNEADLIDATSTCALVNMC